MAARGMDVSSLAALGREICVSVYSRCDWSHLHPESSQDRTSASIVTGSRVGEAHEPEWVSLPCGAVKPQQG